MIDRLRLQQAYEKSRDDLLASRNDQGHWEGELSSSALSTATAISALALFRSNVSTDERMPSIAEQIDFGISYLAQHQNEDGGWGDTDKSYSNISTSTLVVAAFHLAGHLERFEEVIKKADCYLTEHGGAEKIKARYGKDKTFAVPILANAALAGLVSWKDVGVLPFEAAVVPQKFYHFMQLPVVSYAIPALVAIGQAKFINDPPRNPFTRMIRKFSIRRSMKVLERMQPTSGGYLEAIPLTSFVVMSLAATGRCDHPVTQNGVRFILDSFREAEGKGQTGSWPIDTNLATWNTSLSVNALASSNEDVASLDCWPWLLDCQYKVRHPFTGAKPGAWGWSDLSGAVPDADDTPGAIISLKHLRDRQQNNRVSNERIDAAIAAGQKWLVSLQNRDGGWPTFCRGWGKLPFDRSGTDLTAHALRAFCGNSKVDFRVIERGFKFLDVNQRPSGCWIPLWFGNQDNREFKGKTVEVYGNKRHTRPEQIVQVDVNDEENPVYGTAKVLMAYRDWKRFDTQAVRNGLKWMLANQNADGGWGGGPSVSGDLGNHDENTCSSIEETALAVEALADFAFNANGKANFDQLEVHQSLDRGVELLTAAVEKGTHHNCWPIGFYFAKLWYYEKLYPLIFATAALGRVLRNIDSESID